MGRRQGLGLRRVWRESQRWTGFGEREDEAASRVGNSKKCINNYMSRFKELKNSIES